MATNSPVVIDGMLKADDTIELASHPPLRPGPVRVKLEALPEPCRQSELPAASDWEDNDMISAPFDLPLPGNPQPVVVRQVTEVLPPPFELSKADLAPE